LELRQNADGTRSIVGEAVVYNSLSEDLGGFRERIAPGAFRNSLRTTEVMALYSHQDADILGRQSSGTLTITDSPDALRFDCKLPNTTVGRDVQELCSRGDLKGMSFGFTAVQDDWTTGADGTVIRTVQEAILHEISAVGSPAYTSSTVSLRSCPANLRAKLTTRDADDDDDTDCDPTIDADCDPDDEDDDDEQCSCRCERCVMGSCRDCYNTLCADLSCRDAECGSPAHDEARADALRVAQYFHSRHLNL
jgi:hypothetical protein